MTAAFLDSNILVYAYSEDQKALRARQLLAEDYALGVQTLNEFAYVARRKLKLSWEVIERASHTMSENAELVLPTLLADHRASLHFAQRYQLSIYDALMLAIALRAGCTTFYSEDMHPGLII